MAVGATTRQLAQTSRGNAAVPPKESPIPLPQDTQKRIAEKAYALYEQRGKREGYALQDWLDAEYLVNEQIYEAH